MWTKSGETIIQHIPVGIFVGFLLGLAVGFCVGRFDGLIEGLLDGVFVGFTVHINPNCLTGYMCNTSGENMYVWTGLLST